MLSDLRNRHLLAPVQVMYLLRDFIVFRIDLLSADCSRVHAKQLDHLWEQLEALAYVWTSTLPFEVSTVLAVLLAPSILDCQTIASIT